MKTTRTKRSKPAQLIATRGESIQWADETIPEKDRADIHLADGNPNACRLFIDAQTREPVLNQDGSQSYGAPWLLTNIFSL